VIEVDREYPEYVFILDANRRVGIVNLAPGHPLRLNRDDWVGEWSRCLLVAVPVSAYDGRDAEDRLRGWVEQQRRGELAWVIDFNASVWLYDTRGKVVNTYRITGDLGKPSRIEFQTTPESIGGKIPRYAIGLLLTAAAVLGVRRFLRRRRSASA
jgi:hypothetical protein